MLILTLAKHNVDIDLENDAFVKTKTSQTFFFLCHETKAGDKLHDFDIFNYFVVTKLQPFKEL